MNNDNIELIKFVELQHYDLNLNKTKVHVDTTTSEISIDLYLNRRLTACPFCGSYSTVINKTISKNVNHCVKPQQKITINFHQKKFKCKECQHYFMETNNIGNGISIFGAIQMINQLRNPRKTFLDVAQDCFTTINTVINYFDKMVSLARHPLTKIICIDEIYTKKLTKTKYSLILYDPISNTILDVLDARLKDVLNSFLNKIPVNERLKVEYVNIDMWTTYVNSAQLYFPNATICVDSFHVIKHLNDAMNKIRLKVQRRFVKDKDSDKKSFYWLIRTFHYYFVSDFDSIKYIRKPKSHYSHLWDKHAVLNQLLSIDDNLTEAYYLKEEYREFNLTEEYNSDTSLSKLNDFIEKFKKSHFEEFREFGSLLNHWKYYIVNSFIKVNGKRMSNGPMESVNGRIGRILSNGYGYSNFERFRNRVMFSLNKDEPIK